MKKIFFISTILAFCFYSCVYDHVETVAINNLSDKDLAVCYTCADTLLEYGNDSLWNVYYKIKRDYDAYLPYPPFLCYDHQKKNEKNSVRRIIFLYKNNIDKVCKDGTIKFFFIDYSIFSNNSIDTIAKYQLYKKMVFSNKDLKAMNWTIEYK